MGCRVLVGRRVLLGGGWRVGVPLVMFTRSYPAVIMLYSEFYSSFCNLGRGWGGSCMYFDSTYRIRAGCFFGVGRGIYFFLLYSVVFPGRGVGQGGHGVSLDSSGKRCQEG